MAKSKRQTSSQEVQPDSAQGSTCRLFSISAIFFFAIALISMPPMVTLEDSGEFILTAHRLGIPHPPGYPLYVWIGHLFTYLPIGSIAWRIHLFSAVCGAAACGFVALSARRLGVSFIGALATAALFAVSKTFWNQAIIAEVYALNALFFFALLWMALGIHEKFEQRQILLFSFLYGLSLSNHWPLIGLASGVFAILFAKHARQILRVLPLAIPIGLLGLLPYLLLFATSDVAFLGPIRNLTDLLRYFLRSEYAADDVQATATAADSIQFFFDFFRQLIFEFGPLGLPFVAFGFWNQLRSRPWIAIGFLAAFLSSPLLLLFALRLENNMLTRDVFTVFYVVPFGIAAIWIGFSLEKLPQYLPKAPNQKKALLIAVSAVLVAQAFVTNAQYNFLRHDTFPFEFAKLSLESLPQNAVYLGWADPDVGSFIYTNAVENVRPDVLYTTQTGVILNRLFDRRDTLIDTQRAAVTADRIRKWFSEGRRVFSFRKLYYFTARPETFPFKYIQHGLYYEIVNDLPANMPKLPVETARQANDILDRVASGQYGTQWTYYRNMMMARLCRTLILHKMDHPIFNSNRECEIVRAETLRDAGDIQTTDRILEKVMKESDDLPLLDQIESAKFYLLTRIAVINQAPADAGNRLAAFQAAIDRVEPLALRVPGCNNSLALAILEARAQIPLRVDLGRMGSMFGMCETHRKFLKEIGKKK